MTGLDEFLSTFGSYTVLEIVEFILACVFIVFVYKKIRDYIIAKHDSDKKRDEQLQEALGFIKEYKENHESLENEIKEMKESLNEYSKRLSNMEEDTKRRERNKLRDRLLQNYRYYTNIENNPDQTWTIMESEAFWDLFKDYEDSGGDGYVHSVVQTEMLKLKVVEMNK